MLTRGTSGSHHVQDTQRYGCVALCSRQTSTTTRPIMSHIDFWQQVYLVAIRLGTNAHAKETADLAVLHLKETLKGIAQQPSLNAGNQGN